MKVVLLFLFSFVFISCTSQIQKEADLLDKELAIKPILSADFSSLLNNIRKLPTAQQAPILFRITFRDEKGIDEIEIQEKLSLEILPIASKKEKKKLLLRLVELYNKLNYLALPGVDIKGIERCKELEDNYSLSQEERWNIKKTKALLLTRLGLQEQYLPLWFELLAEHRTAERPVLITEDLYTIANHFNILGDQERSLSLYQEAYQLAIDNQLHELQYKCLVAIVNLLYNVDQYTKAIDYCNEEKIDPIVRSMTLPYFTLSKCYLKLQMPDSARFYLAKIPQNSKQENGYFINISIAETYISESREDSASFYLEKATKLFRKQFPNSPKSNVDRPLSFYFLPIYTSFAELLQRNGKPQKASEAFNQVIPSMEKTTKIPTQWKQQINALTKYSSFCRNTKQYEKALDLLARRDSLQFIYNIRQKDRDSKNLADRFEIEKLQHTIDLQQAELGYSKRFNAAVFICCFFLILFMVGFYFLYRSRKKEILTQMEKVKLSIVAQQEKQENSQMGSEKEIEQKEASDSTIPAKTRLLFRNAEKKLVSEELYRNQKLSINQFAEALGTNRIELSKCINACTKLNYSKWINKYRIDYVLKRFKSIQGLEELRKEAGFSSNNAFYSNFHEITKLNPTEYLIARGLEQFEEKKQKSPKKRTTNAKEGSISERTTSIESKE